MPFGNGALTGRLRLQDSTFTTCAGQYQPPGAGSRNNIVLRGKIHVNDLANVQSRARECDAAVNSNCDRVFDS